MQISKPVTYWVQGREIVTIPDGITLIQRETFLLRHGAPRQAAAVFAMQDRAASLAGALCSLIEQSGDADLIANASRLIEQWNGEVGAHFQRGRRH